MNCKAKKIFQQKIGLTWPPSSEWWAGEFLEATKGGVTPYLFKKVLPNEFPGTEEVTNAFRLMQKLRDVKKARVRLYIGEERRDDLATKSLDSQFSLEESLPDFMIRITGEERFGLLLNRLQDWSESFTKYVGVFLQSMFTQQGIPLGGSEIVLFAGNYASTPFGVHRGFENAFLIHLGPGIKEFHCWSESLYKELTGSLEPTFGKYEHLLGESEKFVLEPGDIFYLPALVYHVGKQEDFSISVTCPLYTYPIKRLLKQIIFNLVDQIPFDETGASPYQTWVFDTNPLQKFTNTVAEKIFDNWKNIQIPSVLDDYWFRLISNGGFDVVDILVDETNQETDLSSLLPLKLNTTLRLKKPYKICWSTRDCTNGNMQVYLRAYAVALPYSEQMIKLFEHLNEGRYIVLQDFENSIEVLTQLSKTNGFELL